MATTAPVTTPSPPRPTQAEQIRAGVALRRAMRRRDHAALVLPERDVIGVLEEQHATRLPALVPTRVGRMMQSPFAFYRGSAAQMAHDLRDADRTDVRVVACGDAHLGNFGFFASPERRLVFDLNDFDEVNVAPWEWDVKRLGASIELAGREAGGARASRTEAVVGAIRAYRHTLDALYEMSALDRFYYRVDSEHLAEVASSADQRRLLRNAQKKAKRRTSDALLGSITTTGPDGAVRIVDQPPVLRHLGLATRDEVIRLMDAYRDTVQPDVAVLLEQYELADAAFRVVGVGSVGLRAHVALLLGPAGEPLFLQPKEAVASVLVTYGGMPFGRADSRVLHAPATAREGWRVVTGQRVMQAVSDRFLGWFTSGGRDYYIRQFRDMKGSIDLSGLSPALLAEYAALCGALLARAHAQSPRGAMIQGYLSDGDRFDAAVAEWSRRYGDQVERDHAALVSAVRTGRLEAEQGV